MERTRVDVQLDGHAGETQPAGVLDVLVDEQVEVADVDVRRGQTGELHVYPGAFHGSNNSVSRSALSRRWKADERAALHRALHGTEIEG